MTTSESIYHIIIGGYWRHLNGQTFVKVAYWAHQPEVDWGFYRTLLALDKILQFCLNCIKSFFKTLFFFLKFAIFVVYVFYVPFKKIIQFIRPAPPLPDLSRYRIFAPNI